MAIGKILCLGDALTAGDESNAGGYRSYRGALQQLLRTGGYTIDFVGTKVDVPATGGTDGEHDGYDGARMMVADSATNSIEGRVSTIRTAVGAVDIIILYIGWNDVYSATASVDTKHASLVTTILSGTWASAKLVMVTLSPEPNKTAAQTGSDYSRYALLNSTIRGAVSASKIVADLAAATTSATADRDAMVEKLLFDAATAPTVVNHAGGSRLPAWAGGHFIPSFKAMQDFCGLWRTTVPERRGVNGGTGGLAPSPDHVGHPYFINSVRALAPWLWVFAGPGHASSNTVVEARNMYAQALRGSNGQWEFFYEGARPGFSNENSSIYDGTPGTLRGARGDGITSYYRVDGGANIESWAGDTVPSRGILQFVGGESRSLMVDAVQFVVGVQVRLALLDPGGTNDIPQSRFIVACGFDAFAGAAYRYDYWGWPYEMMDGGHDRWQILNATDWIWIGSIPMDRGSGHWEDPATPPPHVYQYSGGAYPYNDPPTYSKTATQIRANPPRLPRYYSGGSTTGGASAWVPGDYWFNPGLGALDIHYSQQGGDRAGRIIFDALVQSGFLSGFTAGSGEPVTPSPLPGVGSIASWLNRFHTEATAPPTAKWRGLNEAVVTAAPVWGPATGLPFAAVGVAYSGQLVATGEPTPTYSHLSGKPAWMSVSSGGALTGTPNESADAVYQVTMRASNSVGTSDRIFELRVGFQPNITTTTLPSAAQGQAYSQQIVATGSPLVEWTLFSGSLPAGMQLSATGLVFGTPTATGTSSFTVQAANGFGAADTQALSLTVGVAANQPAITTTSLPSGTVGAAYSQTVAATGAATITFSIVEGALPTGLAMSTAGAITGTPTVAGYYAFKVRAANAFTPAAERELAINIVPAGAVTTTGGWSKWITR